MIRVPTTDKLNRGANKEGLSKLGFSFAKVIHRTGLRAWIPPQLRRSIKRRLSSEISEDRLQLDESVSEKVRHSLAPEMAVIRRMVENPEPKFRVGSNRRAQAATEPGSMRTNG